MVLVGLHTVEPGCMPSKRGSALNIGSQTVTHIEDFIRSDTGSAGGILKDSGHGFHTADILGYDIL